MKIPICLILASVTIWAAAGTSELEAVKLKTPVIIDGRLEESVWKTARFHDQFKRMESDVPATRRTEAAIAYDHNALIVGVRAYVPDAELKTTALFDECVEVMLDPQGTSDTYYHFAVGANGMLFDRKCEQSGYVGDAGYDSGFSAGVFRGKDMWSAEIRIPFRALELTAVHPDFWSVNLARESSGRRENEISAIGEKGRLNVKSAFLKMKTPEVDFTPFFWSSGEPVVATAVKNGKLAADFRYKITNQSATERSIKAELYLTCAEHRLAPFQSNPFTVAAGADTEVNFPDIQLSQSGMYQAALRLRDAATNRIVNIKRSSHQLRFVPLTLQLHDPHYRNAIFATQQLDQVRCTVRTAAFQPDMKMVVQIRRQGAAEVLATSEKPIAPALDFAFPVSQLPDGRLEITAQLREKDGTTAAATTVAIRKLPRRQGEVWRGKDRNWYIDGKKVFMLLSWSNADFHFPEFLAALNADSRFGGLYISPIGFGLSAPGIRKILQNEGVTPQVEDFFRARAQEYLKNPRLFAHYWVDEPDCQGMSRKTAAAVAAVIADADPYHPVIISTGTQGVISYSDCGEINGFHCYPNPIPGQPMSNFMKIVVCMDKAKDFFTDDVAAQSIAYLHQGFDYSEHNARNSRIPSYDEYRSQNLLALILGAQGLLHYNVFRGDYPELQLGIPVLLKEQQLVGEEAIIQTPLPVPRHTPALRMRAMKNPQNGAVWLLACNASYEPREFSINLPELADRMLQVLSEERTVKASGGKFTDVFQPFEVHVYTSDQRNFNLTPRSQIQAAIEEAYARRAKPGNLAYQRFENSRLEVNASSNINQIAGGPRSNTLWHVTDGVINAENPRGGLGWQDKTPSEVPDWLELEFKTPVKAGRVVVYPAENSLQDYDVQVWRNGAYETVGRVIAAQGEYQEIPFSPVETDKIRIYITKNRRQYSQIQEIEVYER